MVLELIQILLPLPYKLILTVLTNSNHKKETESRIGIVEID